MIRNTDDNARLYLSKGDQIIYIDNCNIPQHHIDGIRFLYRLYKKKKPGAIINDTSEQSRKLQIVLFIKAICHLLDKPVLVLCHEGAEHDWIEQFQTWTDLSDNVILETQKPYIKKQVFINTMSNLSAFCRRDWSVIVMDGDQSPKQVLGLPFKADYKIWVTPINMKENLDKFTQIYTWFYPKVKFDKSEFTAAKNNPADVIEKAILLDAFFEDIVAYNTQNVREDPPPVTISRKNKDATGTKIKRSKRKIYDDDEDIPLSKTTKDDANIPTRPNEPHINDEITEDINMDSCRREDVKEFKDHLPEEEVSTEVKMDTLDSQNLAGLYYEPDTQVEDNSDRLYEMNTLVIDEDHNSDVEHVNDEQTTNCVESHSDLDDEEQIKQDVQNIICTNSHHSSPTIENKNTVNDIMSTIEDLYDRTSPSNLKISDTEDNLEISRDSPSNCDETKTGIIETAADRESPSICDEVKIDNIENNVNYEECKDELTSENKNKNEIHTKLNENEQTDEMTVTNEIAAGSSLKRNCFEDKIKEMEATAFKKFKGSILDSLF